MPLKVVGTKRMSWGEALRLTKILSLDSSSQVGAAVAAWPHPITREAMVLADLYDAFGAANFQKPKPYPRPWDAAKPGRVGDTGGRSRREVIEHLNSLGHHLPMPDDDDEAG